MSRSRSQQPARPRSCPLELNGSPSIRCRSCRRARTTISTPPPSEEQPVTTRRPCRSPGRSSQPRYQSGVAPTLADRPLTRKVAEQPGVPACGQGSSPPGLDKESSSGPTKLLGLDYSSGPYGAWHQTAPQMVSTPRPVQCAIFQAIAEEPIRVVGFVRAEPGSLPRRIGNSFPFRGGICLPSDYRTISWP